MPPRRKQKTSQWDVPLAVNDDNDPMSDEDALLEVGAGEDGSDCGGEEEAEEEEGEEEHCEDADAEEDSSHDEAPLVAKADPREAAPQ